MIISCCCQELSSSTRTISHRSSSEISSILSLVLTPSSGPVRASPPAARTPSTTPSTISSGLETSQVSPLLLTEILHINIPGRDYYDPDQPILPAYDGTQGDLLLTLPPGASTRSHRDKIFLLNNSLQKPSLDLCLVPRVFPQLRNH